MGRKEGTEMTVVLVVTRDELVISGLLSVACHHGG